MTHEGCFADEKFHFVDVQLNMMLLEAFKYCNEVSVVVNSGFSVVGAAARDENVIGNADYLETKVGMMYFGRRMALFRVCDGSKQIRIFPGLVGVGSRSLMTMLEIQSVG